MMFPLLSLLVLMMTTNIHVRNVMSNDDFVSFFTNDGTTPTKTIQEFALRNGWTRKETAYRMLTTIKRDLQLGNIPVKVPGMRSRGRPYDFGDHRITLQRHAQEEFDDDIPNLSQQSMTGARDWTIEEDVKLIEYCRDGNSMRDIIVDLNRLQKDIEIRVLKLTESNYIEYSDFQKVLAAEQARKRASFDDDEWAAIFHDGRREALVRIVAEIEYRHILDNLEKYPELRIFKTEKER